MKLGRRKKSEAVDSLKKSSDLQVLADRLDAVEDRLVKLEGPTLVTMELALYPAGRMLGHAK